MPIPPRHAYLGAPYGIYATSGGYVALAMGSVTDLGKLLQCHALAAYTDAKTWFTARDEIKRILAIHLAGHTTAHWLAILEPAGYWSSNVLTWPELMATEAFQTLDMLQEVRCTGGARWHTTRCPIRIDGELFKNHKPAPGVGQNTGDILTEIRGES
jgi:CoA:oxalate CoA-transferase